MFVCEWREQKGVVKGRMNGGHTFVCVSKVGRLKGEKIKGRVNGGCACWLGSEKARRDGKPEQCISCWRQLVML